MFVESFITIFITHAILSRILHRFSLQYYKINGFLNKSNIPYNPLINSIKIRINKKRSIKNIRI